MTSTIPKSEAYRPSSDASSASASSSPAAVAPVAPAGVLRIALTESLIVQNRQALKMRVVDAIAAGQSTVVLDLASCGYIDSSGLGVLVSLAKKCREAGGSLVLENVNEDLCLMLELSRMDTVLDVRPASPPR